MDGILLIDKPSGWTSFDAVAKVRGIVRKAQSQELRAKSENLSARSPKVKVGHTGTLDPLATGLLVLVLGSYTKRVPELSKADKTYQVTMKLGETSTTGDEEGEKTHVSDNEPSEPEVLAALKHFVGEIEQVPPAYSAIKVDGQRAYKLARAGREVKLEPRKATIYEITEVKYTYPVATFTVRVSSGTYIRTLVEDIGQKLGTGAYMPALRRTQVGAFTLAGSLSPESLTFDDIKQAIAT